MTAVEVIVTGPAEWMTQYANQLVKDHLIACAQLGPIVSTYRWKDEVETASETRAALHTIDDNVAAIIERTQTSHPYDVPCILVMPIQSGNTAYLDWITASCQTEAVITEASAPSTNWTSSASRAKPFRRPYESP